MDARIRPGRTFLCGLLTMLSSLNHEVVGDTTIPEMPSIVRLFEPIPEAGSQLLPLPPVDESPPVGPNDKKIEAQLVSPPPGPPRGDTLRRTPQLIVTPAKVDAPESLNADLKSVESVARVERPNAKQVEVKDNVNSGIAAQENDSPEHGLPLTFDIRTRPENPANSPAMPHAERIALLSKRNLDATRAEGTRESSAVINTTGQYANLGGERRPLTVPDSVQRHANQLVQQAVSLAKRGAYYSARSQLIATMRLVAQALDAQAHTTQRSDALAMGLKALDEAADFAPTGSHLEADLDIAEIVRTHSTPVLQGSAERNSSPLSALQAYHAFAEEQLAIACGQGKVASEALMLLAKIQPRLASHDRGAVALAGPRAMSLYQAALIVDPNNYLAANELAVLFATFGQLEDSRDVLAHCVRIEPNNPTGWKNLAEVHRRIGEEDLAAAAMEEWRLASQQQNAATANPTRPAVDWVEPNVFSAGSEKAAPSSDVPATSEIVGESSQKNKFPPKPSTQTDPHFVSRWLGGQDVQKATR